MAIKHRFKCSLDYYGYGYYGFIDKETDELVIEESWPREGGEIYRGTYANAYRTLRTLKDEAPRLYNSIIKYYTEKPEEAGKLKLSALKPGTKFTYKGEQYMVVDMDISKCFIYENEAFCFTPALDLKTYKIFCLPPDAEVII